MYDSFFPELFEIEVNYRSHVTHQSIRHPMVLSFSYERKLKEIEYRMKVANFMT